MKSEATTSGNREHLRNFVNRILVPHTDFDVARRRIRQLLRYKEAGATEPKCLAVTGESRTGKSRVLKAIESEWPPVRNADGLTTPLLAVRVPANPSIKGMAELLLRKLGAKDWNKGTREELTSRLETLLRECRVLALALDEFHHIVDRRSEEVQHEVADWLKVLCEETKVCLVVLGLPRMTAVIRQNEQLEGRFLAPVTMQRFDWFNDKQRGAWLSILEVFTATLREHFDILQMDSDDVGFRLWCATGGLVGYLTQLLTQATWDALDDSRTRISLPDLKVARDMALFTAEANPEGLPSVLGPRPLVPTEALLKAVRQVGVAEAPRPPRSRRRSRQGDERQRRSELEEALA